MYLVWPQIRTKFRTQKIGTSLRDMTIYIPIFSIDPINNKLLRSITIWLLLSITNLWFSCEGDLGESQCVARSGLKSSRVLKLTAFPLPFCWGCQWTCPRALILVSFLQFLSLEISCSHSLDSLHEDRNSTVLEHLCRTRSPDLTTCAGLAHGWR